MNVNVITKGKFPHCIGTHTVALFDPKTGVVHHLHHALIFEGPRPTDQAMEAIARRSAAHRRFAVSQPVLEALHLRDASPPKGPHRVDLAERKLVAS